MAEVGGCAESATFQFKIYLIALGYQVQNFYGFSHDFWANAVAIKQGDFVGAHTVVLSQSVAIRQE